MSGIDPDDTTGCPREPACETCGADHGGLFVVTANTSVGITCVTVCRWCDQELVRLPAFTASEAVRRVTAHAAHLGCTVDDLAVGR